MLRYKYFNRLPDQIRPFIAEQLIDLPIHHSNGPLLIHHQQAVRRRFDHKAKLLLRMLALSEISYDRRKTVRHPILALYREDGDGHGDLGAILSEIVDFIFARLAGPEQLSHRAIPLILVLVVD